MHVLHEEIYIFHLITTEYEDFVIAVTGDLMPMLDSGGGGGIDTADRYQCHGPCGERKIDEMIHDSLRIRCIIGYQILDLW